MAEVKAVFFDFGGVFTESPFSAFDAMGADLGAKPGQLSEIIFGSYGIDGDHPWHQLERGEITLDNAREGIMQLGRDRFELNVDIYELLAKMPRDGGLRHELVDRVGRIKSVEKLPTAIITNNVKEFSDGWRSLLPVDELFDFVVDSCEEGVRKPEEAIFELALARMGDFAPEHTVFLDDHEANIATASRLGMQTVHVGPDISEAIKELDSLLAQS